MVLRLRSGFCRDSSGGTEVCIGAIALLSSFSPTKKERRGMNTKLRYIASICAITLALVWCIPSVGQVIKGSISGTVVDPQGAVVSGAQVKAKNIETGVVSSTTTDSAGIYRLNL